MTNQSSTSRDQRGRDRSRRPANTGGSPVSDPSSTLSSADCGFGG